VRQVNRNAHPEFTCGTLWDECHMCTTCGTVQEGSWNDVGQQPPIIRKPTTKYWLFSVTLSQKFYRSLFGPPFGRLPGIVSRSKGEHNADPVKCIRQDRQNRCV